ncbi:MAG: DEAD/DEAH box helicase, partial [Planctomycetota bacterium]
MFEKVLTNAGVKSLAQMARPGSVARASGVWGAAAAMVAAAVARISGRVVLVVTGHLDRADEIADDVEVFTGTPAGLLPAWEVDTGSDHLSGEVGAERLRVCQMLTEGRQAGAEVYVAPVMALLQPVPKAEAIEKARRTLRVGQDCGPEELAAWLVDAGYDHVDQVEGQGEFARRGGIVDLFPQGLAQALRVEFFGDVIDSIRRFDLDSQRSTERVESCDLATMRIAQETDPAATMCLLEALPADAIVCLIEPVEVRSLAAEFAQRLSEDRPGHGPWQGGRLIAAERLWAAMARLGQVELHTFSPKEEADVVDLGISSLQRLEGETQAGLAALSEMSQEAAVWVFCETPAERERFQEVLAAQHPALSACVHLGLGHVNGGFHWAGEGLVVVGHHEIYHRYSNVRRIRRVRAGRPIDSLLDLAVGDYVVHVAHGIAKFEGLRTLENDSVMEEFITLRFADNAVMHSPATQINLIQRYVGTRGSRPTLSKLGGGLWARQKERAAEAVQDMAAEMLRVQAVRDGVPGTAYPVDTSWQKKFADEFVYTETPDQLATARQIADDMSLGRPMDRLVCGDVGYGKTELAMRAAFCVAEAGRQVAILVPTTVLAAQHYRTLSERFADYPMRIEVLSRFQTAKQQADTIKKLALRQVDIVIGTHRLLSKDVKFADLGLAVIDEEQRFGVAHKEHLKTLRSSVEVLTMTATPIPRTLHMALLGLRDISSLTTPPMDRRAIHTEVCQYDEGRIATAVRRELAREGQTFLVHNRVFDIEALAEKVRSLVPGARVEIGHGQMPQGQLERIMRRFVLRDIDVLVCTTIIESGLDIPNA